MAVLSVTGEVCQYSVDRSVSLVNKFKSDVTNPVGPCWDGETMYIADLKNNTLYAFKMNGFGGLALMQRYVIPAPRLGALSAIAAADGKMFLLYDDEPSFVVLTSIGNLRKTND